MSINYAWSIKSIKSKKNENGEEIVSEIYWVKTGKDSKGVSGSFEGVVAADKVPSPEGSETKFIPYKKLKEADVLEWVKSVVSSYEEHVDKTIQKQIDEQNNVLIDTPLPWEKTQKNSK